MAIIRRLTQRDRAIAHAIASHRVLTTDQLAEAFFSSRKRALARLSDLHRMEVLERFTPYRLGWGSNPLHFVLGRTGTVMLAVEAGRDPVRAARAWRLERAVAIGLSQQLPHLLGINDMWALMAGYARRNDDAELRLWLTESEVDSWTGGLVRPDAICWWYEGGVDVEVMVEYDRSTEPLRVLAAKLTAYERLEAERGRSVWILFAFTSPGREATARAALAGATVPAATAVVTPTTTIRDDIWLPLDAPPPRVALTALTSLPKPPDALQRASYGSPRAWRYAPPDPREEGADTEP